MAKKNNAMRYGNEDPNGDTMEHIIDPYQNAGYDMESHQSGGLMDDIGMGGDDDIEAKMRVEAV